MNFDDFNFHPDIVKGIKDMGFVTPTPIQAQSIPPILEGKDIIANAQTGSGKTAAFLLPLMHRIMDKPPGKTRVLILAPTRELACQIDEQALGFGYHTKVKCCAIYGGVRMERQEQWLLSGITMIAATPGRLLDHFKYDSWKLDELDALVLDEADRMLDMGFWPDIQSIIQKLPPKKQVLLFSATMPPPIVEFAKKLMIDPVHIKIGLVKPPSSISQFMYPIAQHLKEKLLLSVLQDHDVKSTIIFVGTKIGTERLYRSLSKIGIAAGAIHGDMEQVNRDKVIVDFKSGKVQVLVATDVASRGIDIDGISHVINYDIPNDADTYIHRIGRTARNKAEGDAITFITSEDRERVREIEKVIGKTIPKKEEYDFQKERDSRGPSHFKHRRPGQFKSKFPPGQRRRSDRGKFSKRKPRGYDRQGR